ncbi:MAG: undecaprenyl/decaprenyl-phosphate alpha-N-acetylglucosaminyl 1-phosphate transferase [Nitrosomonas sp.]|nr:MAG: undecaprenyl/decaprenyl-phosphate alpha-N-acetylglucosaminyl 1-phosphate transferase [Nitrosomonas sp.]
MMEISLELLGLILSASIFLSMLMMPVVSRLAHRIKAIDIPKHRSVHKTPTPRIGGLAISISLIANCLAFLPLNSFMIAFLLGMLIIIVTGIIDDIMEISPRWKFVGQILAALIFIYFSDMKIETIGDVIGIGDIPLGEGSYVFTILFLVGTINAFNFADGLDGLAGGISIIAAVFFGYFAWIAHQEHLLIIIIVLIGSTMGFMRYNCYPTRVFMGDSGSMVLGYTLAVLLIGLNHFESQSQLSLFALAMVIALPLWDLLVVMMQRLYRQHNPFFPDRSHRHHRLFDAGLSHPAVVMILYFEMFCFGLMSITLYDKPEWMIFLSFISLGGLLILFPVSFIEGIKNYYNVIVDRYHDSIQRIDLFKRLTHWLRVTVSPIGISIYVALLLPVALAPLLTLDSSKVLGLSCLAALMVFFSFRTRRAGDQSIQHGIFFLSAFTVLVIYNLSFLDDVSWLAGYINVLSVVTLTWVLFILLFARYNNILFTPDFELLVLLICSFVAFVLIDELMLNSLIPPAVQQAFLMTIPFYLAMKITIRNRHQNHWFSIFFIFAIVIAIARAAN